MEAVLGSDVPQEYADSIAQLFIGSAQGAYAPFLDCRGYEARAMEACYEVGGAWRCDRLCGSRAGVEAWLCSHTRTCRRAWTARSRYSSP